MVRSTGDNLKFPLESELGDGTVLWDLMLSGGQGVGTELLVGVYPFNSTCPSPNPNTHTQQVGAKL